MITIKYLTKKLKETNYVLWTALITLLLYSKKIEKDNIQKVLIIKPDGIGDVVMVTPLIKTLKDSLPNAKISMAVGFWAKEIVEDNPDINEIIVYNSEFFNKRTKTSLKEKLEFIKKIKAKKFDLIINMRADFETFLLALNKPSKYLINWETNNLLNIIKKRKIHRVDSNLEVLKPLSLTRINKELFIADSEAKWAESYLRKNKIKKFAMIHPGGNWIYRRWSEENFAKMSDWIIKNKRMKIILMGSKEEDNLLSKIVNLMHEKPIILQNLSLKKCASLLKRAEVFIGNDSGIGHIAAAMKTKKIISLFGPEDEIKFRPYSKTTIVLKKKMSCSPCNQFCCKHPENNCMNQIITEEVIKQIK